MGNLRNRPRKFILCVWVLVCLGRLTCFSFPLILIVLSSTVATGTVIRSSLKRCCQTVSWTICPWKNAWVKSEGVGSDSLRKRRTVTKEWRRKNRGSTKCISSSGLRYPLYLYYYFNTRATQIAWYEDLIFSQWCIIFKTICTLNSKIITWFSPSQSLSSQERAVYKEYNAPVSHKCACIQYSVF